MASPEPLQPYRRVQASADADLKRVLELAAKDIQARVLRMPRGVGGDVRGAQLRLTLSAIQKIQRSMWRNAVDPRVASGIDDAEKAAETAIETMTRVAYASLPDGAAKVLVDGLRAAAESGLKSDKARRKRELSTRVYRQEALHTGKVEDMIRTGLISNLTAKELARGVYEYVSPTTPGGASYAAMRLARTEINNAFHERQVSGAKRPGVKAARWNLSGSHKVPDECNVYAVQNKHGEGSGLYPADQIPDKPHPQCFCYLTYEAMAPKEFSDALASGDFDEEIDRRTKANLARLGQPVGDTPADKPVRRLRVVEDVPEESAIPTTDNIKKSVASGIVSSEKLTGGVSAETSKVKFNDGKTGVRKFIGDPSAKRQQDAEELVPLLARMMGIKAPEVTRVDEQTTIQQFLPGKVAAGALPWILNPGTPQAKVLSASARVKSYVESDTGWLMGVLDQVTGNQDRHDGNWLIGDDGEISAVIDHGLAYAVRDWRTKAHARFDLAEAYIFRTKSEFTKKFAKANGDQTKIDFHPEDLDAIKTMMETLKPEYEARGRLDWWEFSMKQIDALRPFANGKKRRIK